jgi:broad specificity phosphatase PhoE
MKIIFESHATSVDNENKIASGWLDPPLSQKGIKQAKEMGQRYEKEHFSHIYVSDLSRSFETAHIAFGSQSILKDARLREWNYGQFNGFPVSEVDKLKIDHAHIPFPCGESLEQVINRFLSFEQECLKTGKILIIGHRAIYYCLEFLFRKTPIMTLLTTPWNWQPGWHYRRTL